MLSRSQKMTLQNNIEMVMDGCECFLEMIFLQLALKGGGGVQDPLTNKAGELTSIWLMT